jgi:predicted lipoprotein with Yx(FWY)xxD motif
MKKLIRNGVNLLALLVLVGISSCSKDDDDKPPADLTEVKLQTSTTLGSYLVDKDGRTLYYFSNDANGQNNCTGGCELLWPVFNVDNLSAGQLGEGLDIADFTTVTTSTNKKQLVYKGWPLYYYAPNAAGTNTPEAAGLTGGEGFGGVWFVAKPDYTIMLANTQLVGNDGKSYKSDYTEGTGKTIYFTDGKGLTLYTFVVDKQNKNNFTAADFSNNSVWPIYETDQIVVPSVLDKALFGSIDVYGKKQLTYKGWPLYYFGADGGVRGMNKGVSVPTPGIWPVAVKDVAAATP